MRIILGLLHLSKPLVMIRLFETVMALTGDNELEALTMRAHELIAALNEMETPNQTKPVCGGKYKVRNCRESGQMRTQSS